MAFKFSTGLRNSLLGAQDTTGAVVTLAFTVTTNVITTSAQNFLTLGFRPGGTIGISGSALNNIVTPITSIASDGLTMVVEKDLANEAEGATVTITACAKTFKDVFRNNVIRIYSGAAPADANAAETGALLLKITKSSGAVVPGVATNGNNFDAIATGVLSKDANVWSGAGLSDGTAGYWRMYDNGEVSGAEATSKRCQGLCGTSGSEFVMSSTSIVTGATVTLDVFNVTQPAS